MQMFQTDSIDKSKLTHLGDTLKYAFYVIFHPLDGFWDLTHEKRGSIAAANVITAALILVEILRLTLTDFQFVKTHGEDLNIVVIAFRILLPMLLWTVVNWGLTTLLDGKGRLLDIYMATAYAFTPYILINAVMIAVSHVITLQEDAIYIFFTGLAMVWCVFLVLAAMMEIHDYSLTKAIGSTLLSIVGMGVMLFIFLIFFGLITDAVAFFIAIYKELIFRGN
ncbi:MAG: YIP1 family protein [Treponema sp.]|jgi:hypothetical protein|nr:YIP1 family protein [Treponema sp.]